jgi:hypothetical protein
VERRTARSGRRGLGVSDEHLNSFQVDCERRVLLALEALDGKVVEREVGQMIPVLPEAPRFYVVGKVEGSGLEFWIYPDGANIGGKGVDDRFEYEGFPSLNELRDTFIARLLTRLANVRGKSPKEITNPTYKGPWWKLT